MLWPDLIGEAWEYLNLAAEQMPHDIGVGRAWSPVLLTNTNSVRPS